MAFLHARPTSTTSATLVKMLLSPGAPSSPLIHTPAIAERMHIGTIRMIASGSVQLS